MVLCQIAADPNPIIPRVTPDFEVSRPLRMNVKAVIAVAKRFLEDEAGHTTVEIESVEADEKGEKWKIIADVGFLSTELKEVTVDDSDGNVLSYRDI